ncbi:formate acetyltransferase [Spirochaetia bacterium]|nr:formate acetyltransferase [Spirochaetia bacterium]
MVNYQEKIKALHKLKLEFNDEKLRRTGGSYNTDDHGWIPLDLADTFKPVADPSCNLVVGMEATTRTFANFLDAHPVFYHPACAFAGSWIGTAKGFSPTWRPENRQEEHEKLFPQYNIISRGLYAMNHSAPDLRIGLELGWGGLLEKIRHYQKLNHPQGAEFYEGEARVVEAVQRYIARHVEALKRDSAATADPALKAHYTVLAEMNEYLINGAPRTLREALQWIVHWQDVDRMYFNGGAGQEIDTLLQAYYERDIQSGAITGDDEVVWFFASLFFNDPHYHMIGGQDPASGNDVATHFSFLILEGQHLLNIPNNLALRVHENSNDELFTKAVEYLFQDGTGVCYSLAEGLDTGYIRNGHPRSIARMRAKVGCNWTALPGIEYALQDVTRVCLAQPILMALDDMLAEGGECGMERLLTYYEKRLGEAVQLIKDGVDWHYEYKWNNRPEVVLNLVAHGPIERGIDMSHGGVDIYNFACDATALATAANSLAAIEQRVVKEQRLTWEQLQKVLKENYKDAEDIRLMLKSVPQFGAGDTAADKYAVWLAELYTRLMRDTPTKLGFVVLPGIFSHGEVYAHGKNLGATPNGRFSGTEISHSADPDPGFLPGGGTAPTAKANAVAAVQSGWGNSTPLQLDIDAKLAKEAGGIQNIKALIRSHNRMGGTLININVISKEKILEAHANPDRYPDLVVRVTGYSAFFKSLSPEYRQQVVDRWLAYE